MEYVGLVADEIEMRGVPDPPVCWKLKYAKTFLLDIDYWGQMIKMVSMDIGQVRVQLYLMFCTQKILKTQLQKMKMLLTM